MRCLHPSPAWLVPARDNPSGKRLSFVPLGAAFRQIKVPCGKCIPCLINRKRKWIIRCAHEMEVSAASFFITLTYDEDHKPRDGKLRPDDFTNFVKRFRKAIEPDKVRYFGCGEYGSETHRPHYHLCLFFKSAFSDVVLDSVLQRTWQFGFHSIGEMTLGRIEYTAGYILKKLHPILDMFGEEMYKPFFRCSQGLGGEYAAKYWSEFLANGGIRYKGKVYPIPDYYLNKANEVYCDNPRMFEYYARKMAALSESGELPDNLELYFARAFEEKTQRAYYRSQINGKNI